MPMLLTVLMLIALFLLLGTALYNLYALRKTASAPSATKRMASYPVIATVVVLFIVLGFRTAEYIKEEQNKQKKQQQQQIVESWLTTIGIDQPYILPYCSGEGSTEAACISHFYEYDFMRIKLPKGTLPFKVNRIRYLQAGKLFSGMWSICLHSKTDQNQIIDYLTTTFGQPITAKKDNAHLYATNTKNFQVEYRYQEDNSCKNELSIFHHHRSAPQRSPLSTKVKQQQKAVETWLAQQGIKQPTDLPNCSQNIEDSPAPVCTTAAPNENFLEVKMQKAPFPFKLNRIDYNKDKDVLLFYIDAQTEEKQVLEHLNSLFWEQLIPLNLKSDKENDVRYKTVTSVYRASLQKCEENREERCIIIRLDTKN